MGVSEPIATLVGFAVVGALSTWLESLWPEDREQPRWRADSKLDVKYLSMRIGLSVLLAILTVLTGASIPKHEGALVGMQPVWLQVLEILLLGDLLVYWFHRVSHHWPALWHVHAIHHSSEKIDWLV